MTPNLKLRDFTTDQLSDELARRRNESSKQRPRKWCDECVNFLAWSPGKDPKKYKPCTKGNTVRFHAPEHISDEYGYYRAVCKDRHSLKESA